METDRRGFLRVLAGGLALLSARPARARARERALEIHRETRNTRLRALGVRWPDTETQPSTFKPYPGRQRITLPRVVAAPSLSLSAAIERHAPARGFAADPLSLDELSRLLYFANGVTGRAPWDPQLPLRAAPSAGALYAGEVYVLAERVRGLEPGAYYYAVADHELVALRAGSRLDAVRAAFEEPDAVVTAAAWVLLTNVFHRYHRRYANRGYRYALIDTGHIGENLRLAAVSAGLAEARPPRFADDVLNELVGVDGREEAVCAIHALGRPGESARAGSSRARLFLSEKQRVAPERIAGIGRVAQRYHEATKLVPAAAAPARIEPAPRPAPGPSAIALPAAPAAISVEASVRARRSPLRFVPEPIRLEQLALVLHCAQGLGARSGSGWVRLYVAAHRVSGLAPGLYRYRPQDLGLAELRAGTLRRALVRACLGQGMAETAAAGCLMVGRLREATARAGDRGYRDLLVAAGELAERIYLGAEAAGIAARNLAAFVDDELNELLGLDGRDQAVVHLTMVGRRG